MSAIDYGIFALYMASVLGVGVYHHRRNADAEDYFVGGREMGAGHIGMSVVATDVGGGFSIGLGGLGFAMGLSGSWLLFTGLVGAWLSAVIIIPRVKAIDRKLGLMTYPDLLRHRYGRSVAATAAIVSALGYTGFTGAQILAGTKLASATLFGGLPESVDAWTVSLLVLGGVTIAYTVLGGIKAVIYTDTVQWSILLFGLILVTIPSALHEVGGWSALRAALPAGHFSLASAGPAVLLNWAVAIVPIWAVAMTLYQRMYACSDARTARRAWFLAGLLEYPAMAFAGVLLGMCGRALFPAAESEMAIPLLVRDVLPIGVRGVVVAAYFSAIMSTADSCLVAASGNVVNDLMSGRAGVRGSQRATLVIGVLAVALASRFDGVLDAILGVYSFMVAGLFVPTLGVFFSRRATSATALASMISGGGVALAGRFAGVDLPWGLDISLAAILVSAAVFLVMIRWRPGRDAC